VSIRVKSSENLNVLSPVLVGHQSPSISAHPTLFLTENAFCRIAHDKQKELKLYVLLLFLWGKYWLSFVTQPACL
jgi:hypothetical protein